MSLGNNIYRLRTARNMSQGDLAEQLDVSRQSISKWETDGAVPELDKLIKLSNIFGVTLDELVHAEQAAAAPAPEPAPAEKPKAEPGTRSKTIPLVLLIMAVLCLACCTVIGGFGLGVILMIPFLLGCLVSLLCRRHPLLGACWAMLILVDLYLRFATGLSWATTRLTFMWTYEMNYMRLFIAWVQLLSMLAMIVATVLAYRKEPLALVGTARTRYILGWVGVIVVTLIMRWGTAFLLRTNPLLLHFVSSGIALQLVTSVLDYLRLFLLTIQLTATVRWWKTKKGNS